MTSQTQTPRPRRRSPTVTAASSCPSGRSVPRRRRFARSGAFRLGGTVVGTQAFRHYEGLLGVHLGLDQSAVTQDIDLWFKDLSDPNLMEALKKVGGVYVAPTGSTPAWRAETATFDRCPGSLAIERISTRP